MELELGLALPNNSLMRGFDLNDDITNSHRKRGFDEAFGGHDDEDCDSRQLEYPHGLNNGPPIKCTKRNEGNGMRGNKSVKVKMEGVAIGRKVDLSVLHSYHALFNTLYRMFPNQHDGKMAKGDGAWGTAKQQHQKYTITYEDEDGDCMLVGDVPWETFIRSVKRLKILVDQSP